MNLAVVGLIAWAVVGIKAITSTAHYPLMTGRSLQEEFDVLGGDAFFINFGEFNVTTEIAQENCPLQYEIVVVCASVECSDFATVCPNNNSGAEITQETTCESIDTTICDTFRRDDGCCMSACALELQDLALCVRRETITSSSGNDLTCDSVPSCSQDSTAGATADDTDETNLTTEISINPPELDLDCNLEGERFTCLHSSNITTANGTVIKTAESTINCAYDEDLGFDMFASNDCSCILSELTSVTNSNVPSQFCACNICSSSTANKLVSIDCIMDLNDAFVVGQCVNQTCGGQCVNQEGRIVSDSSEAPTTSPTAMVATTSEPSMSPSQIPTVLQQTDTPTLMPSLVPSNLPSIQPTTMAPSSLPSVTPTTSSIVVTPSPTTTTTPPATTTDSPTIVATTTATTIMPTSTPSLIPTPEQTNTPGPTTGFLLQQEPTIVPTVATTSTPTSTPTITPIPSTFPSTSPAPTQCPHEYPTGCLSYGNVTIVPGGPGDDDENSTTLWGGGNNNTNNNETTIANATTTTTTRATADEDNNSGRGSNNKWYNHPAFLTVGGAYSALCILLCVLVSTKNSTPTDAEKEEDTNNQGLTTNIYQ